MNVFPRDDQAIVQRIFGPDVTIGGSMGSPLAPGVVTITVGGLLVGHGRSLADAIRSTQRTLLTIARRQAA